MKKHSLIAMTAVGVAAAIAIPTIAFGNARNNIGSLNFLQAANTPYVVQLTGTAEVPGPGDIDGSGRAAITFDVFPVGGVDVGQVCWDMAYSGIVPPTAAHIHSAAAGVSGPALVTLAPATLGPASATGCGSIDPAVVSLITGNPAGFYIDIQNSAFPGPASGAIRGQLAKGDPPSGEAHMLPAPLRAYDSRDNAGPKIAAGETRIISLATGLNGQNVRVLAVPAGATAAIVTLTVTETVGGGYLKMYSAATTEPATSNINWFANNQTFAVSTQVAVDAAGQVKITSGPSSTQFIVDVVGYLF